MARWHFFNWPQGATGQPVRRDSQGVAGAGALDCFAGHERRCDRFGTSTNFSREDHIHPSDMSRVNYAIDAAESRVADAGATKRLRAPLNALA